MNLLIPIPSLSQNVYQRMHWSQQKRHKDDLFLLLKSSLQLRGGEKVLPPRFTVVEIQITRYGAKKLDQGNLVGGCKPLLDALKDLGAITDDSPKWLKDTYVNEVDTKHQRTEIRLTWSA